MNKVNLNDANDLANPFKIGMVAMQDDDGDMHMCLLSSLMNKGEDKMMFGEFVNGMSKELIYRHPEVGFFIMSVGKEFWTGAMTMTHSVTEGEDYVRYNDMQLFRYNTYCGVSVVHYADLNYISEKQPLNMPGVVANAVKVLAAKNFYAGDKTKKVLRPWAQSFLAELGNLMFIGYMGADGFPKVVPIIQGQSASSSRIVFSKSPYSSMLEDLKDGARVAVYGLSLDMAGVLVKGNYHQVTKGMGYVDIDKVYNPVPPKAGYIYPELKQTNTDFSQEPFAKTWI